MRWRAKGSPVQSLTPLSPRVLQKRSKQHQVFKLLNQTKKNLQKKRGGEGVCIDQSIKSYQNYCILIGLKLLVPVLNWDEAYAVLIELYLYVIIIMKKTAVAGDIKNYFFFFFSKKKNISIFFYVLFCQDRELCICVCRHIQIGDLRLQRISALLQF